MVTAFQMHLRKGIVTLGAPHAADTAADATGRGQGTSEIYRVRREPTGPGAGWQASFYSIE